MKEAGVSAGLKASNIRIVDQAVPPSRPVRPWILLNLALGIVLGLGSGLAAAFLQEHLDNTLKTPDDIERFLRLPALAFIPSSGPLLSGKNGDHRLLARAAASGNGKAAAGAKEGTMRWARVDAKALERSMLSEAFRGLRTSVLLSTASRPPRSLVVVSAQPSEGKTTVCSNLAIALAQLGKRVLVVDGDMRRPSLHDFFGLPNSSGLVNYLTGTEDWRGLVRPPGPRGSIACSVDPSRRIPANCSPPRACRNWRRKRSVSTALCWWIRRRSCTWPTDAS